MVTTFSFEAIGTHWQIDIADPLPSNGRKIVLESLMARIESFDKTYSRFRDDSLIHTISVNSGKYVFPLDADKLFSLYRKLYRLTNGLVTPLIGQALSEAGYDSAYSLTPTKLHKVSNWEDVLLWDAPELTTHKPILLDVGAAGKGYLVDLIAGVLIDHGLKNFCVDAGGDMIQKNTHNQSLRVGLEHPNDPTMVIGVVNLLNKSICGSAGNRRKWGKFHHILNPKTLTSPDTISATWVIADEAILGDALATCLFFVPALKLVQDFSFEYFVLKKDMTFEMSAHFSGEIFLAE